MSTANATCSVLVVGGGIVGLSTAAFLAQRGVDVILVERRPAPSQRLRAKFFYPRTMELYRSLGVEEEIAETSPTSLASEAAVVESLTGREIRRWTLPSAGGGAHTPCSHSTIKQYDLEMIVKAKATALGADLRFGHALVGFEAKDTSMIATVRSDDGSETLIRASFMVGCDGAHSLVRDRLGIQTEGAGDLLHNMGIAVRADIRKALEGRPLAFAFVRQADLEAFVSWDTDLSGAAVSVPFDPRNPDAERRFDDAECHRLAASCLGMDPAEVELVGTYPWRASSWVAEHYRAGRVVLAGDAAHSVPPLGGFGANTGIHDAHNLALKLAAVIGEGAPDDLLDQYERERRPVAQLVVAQSTARLAARPDMHFPVDALQPILEEEAITMGYRYGVGADARVPNPIALHPGMLRAEPGTRAPHVVLTRAGKEISTLDLFGRGLVLLAASEATTWAERADRCFRDHGLAAECHVIGCDLVDDNGSFAAAYGITTRGVVLVRSDGFVVWKTSSAPNFHDGDLLSVLAEAKELSLPRELRQRAFRRPQPDNRITGQP